MTATATLARPGARLRFTLRLLAEGNPALAPGLLAVAVLLVFAGSEAGFYPTVWYGGALFLLGLLAATFVAAGPPRSAPRAIVVALALLAAYTLWSYLSIAWSAQKGAALDGANRTALYLVVLALFSLWPWNARGARAVLGLLGAGIAAIGLVVLLKADGSADPLGFFIDARFSEPAGYINANVALWTIGLFPCLFIACARELHPASRGLFLAAAGLLAGLGLLGQSRGWALALPPALILFVLLGPGRLRSLLGVVAVAAGGLAVSGPVLAVHDEFSEGGAGALVADATGAIVAMAVALGLVGAAWGVAERRLGTHGVVRARDDSGSPLAGRRRPALAAALVALVTVVTLPMTGGDPAGRVASNWDDFKRGADQAERGTSRFTTAGTNRYDFWRVAWDVFEERPARGVGADNFQPHYLKRGISGERPRYAHSLELGVLAQTGAVGALLLFGALGAGLVGVARTLRSRLRPAAAAGGAAGATFLYWLLHASVDWFWEFPGLTASALALLGLAAGLAPRRRPAPRRASERRDSRLPVPAIAAWFAVLAALVFAFALPWLAALEVERAATGWVESPDAAFSRLDRAAALNPFSPRPDLTAGSIALALGRLDQAEAEFADARDREPDNAYALLELGLIAAERDDRGRATALLERVRELDPRDEIVQDTLRGLRDGRYVTAASVNRELLKRARSRVE